MNRADTTVKRRILLADDDLAVLHSIARVLSAEGYVPLLARNGKEALDIAASKPVDLVMLDLNMPVRDGWQTFENLVRDYPLLPIIIITARPNQLFPALAAGVGALMEKPLDFPKLLQTIRDLLQEPVEARLARVAGKLSSFRYFPPIPAA
jgi:CheY-like chemotaxis protein